MISIVYIFLFVCKCLICYGNNYSWFLRLSVLEHTIFPVWITRKNWWSDQAQLKFWQATSPTTDLPPPLNHMFHPSRSSLRQTLRSCCLTKTRTFLMYFCTNYCTPYVGLFFWHLGWMVTVYCQAATPVREVVGCFFSLLLCIRRATWRGLARAPILPVRQQLDSNSSYLLFQTKRGPIRSAGCCSDKRLDGCVQQAKCGQCSVMFKTFRW